MAPPTLADPMGGHPDALTLFAAHGRDNPGGLGQCLGVAVRLSRGGAMVGHRAVWSRGSMLQEGATLEAACLVWLAAKGDDAREES